MKRILIALSLMFALATPATALAYNPLSSACNSGGGARNSTACSADGRDPISGPNGALRKVSFIIASIAGVIAVIIIIIAGFEYVTSNGDAQKTANARTAIIGAAIGLVIIAAAQTILLFVVKQL